jgi:hypothetical protein
MERREQRPAGAVVLLLRERMQHPSSGQGAPSASSERRFVALARA